MELSVPDLARPPRMTTPLLAELVSARVSPAARAWFDQALTAHRDPGAFVDAFTTAARRLGKAPLDLTAPEAEALAAAGLTWPLSGWSVDEAGRVVLLVAAGGDLDEERLASLVEGCYHSGDHRARRAAACRATSRGSPADAKEAWHEDLRSTHPHDVQDDERLPGHGGGGDRRRRRALVLAGSAADPRGDVRGLLCLPPRLGALPGEPVRHPPLLHAVA